MEAAFRSQFPGGDKTAFQLLANVDRNPKNSQNRQFQRNLEIDHNKNICATWLLVTIWNSFFLKQTLH